MINGINLILKSLLRLLGVLQQTRIKAAPVKICIKRIKSGIAQALILNSGNANACTGQKGIEDAMLITEKMAEKINTKKNTFFHYQQV